MIGPDHAVEGACDAFWSALFQAIGETLPQADSTDPDCVRSSSTAPGQGAQSLRSLPGATSTRPTDRHEPNSAIQPNAASGQWGRVESHHPTPAGLGSSASAEGPTPAGSLLPEEVDDEDRGSSGGVVSPWEARRYGCRVSGTPAVPLLPAPTGGTEWA